jgi:hypothetical protein
MLEAIKRGGGDNMLKQLLSIKKIIALLLTVVFGYLSVIKTISSSEFLTVFTMIISFYFGQSTARDAKKD